VVNLPVDQLAVRPIDSKKFRFFDFFFFFSAGQNLLNLPIISDVNLFYKQNIQRHVIAFILFFHF